MGEPEPIEETDERRTPPRHMAPRLGEILIKAGIVDEFTLQRLLKGQAKEGETRLGTLLIERRVCTAKQIRKALHEQTGIEVVDLGIVGDLDPEVAGLIPLDFVRRNEVIPLKREGNRLWVVMLDPYNLAAIDDIRFLTGFTDIVVAACVESDFRDYIREHLDTTSLIDEILDGDTFYDRALSYMGGEPSMDLPEDDDLALHELRLASDQSPIITLTDFMLAEAIKQRASDIHIEPEERSLRVRIRVDGRLRTLISPPKRLEMPIVTRFKVISNLDITNRRVPQDGHLSVAYSQTTVHFRVSTLPTAHGEKCVLRVLKKESGLSSLDKLGLPERDLTLLNDNLATPQGLVLVTGPTGSGKTTTVHACLHHLNNVEVNIVTLEDDPVEFTIPGVSHVNVNTRGGTTFAGGLRSILRQDPDIVFVGEMRDPEVAQIALRASLTGHLVLSTLHTNSAVESLTRLEDMGLAPYLVAGSLLSIVAQRLVRRVCERCSEPVEPDPDEFSALSIDPDRLKEEGVELREGTGCSRCSGSGYFGRIGVYETLKIDTTTRVQIRESSPAQQLFQHAREHGMRTMFENGIEVALAGQTTLSEVKRVVYSID